MANPLRLAFVLSIASIVAGCAAPPRSEAELSAQLPLFRGWFDGQEVFYVTTDVSDAEVARAKRANHAPLLGHAVATAAARAAGQRAATAKVYVVVNHEQPGIFASAPSPVGASNTSAAYSPLWQMVKVAWREPREAKPLRSEEEVLAAAERGAVMLETTPVVLNCPIVGRAGQTLPGVAIDGR